MGKAGRFPPKPMQFPVFLGSGSLLQSIRQAIESLRFGSPLGMVWVAFCAVFLATEATGQSTEAAKTGTVIDVSLPLTGEKATAVLAQLASIAEQNKGIGDGGNKRRVVVLRIRAASETNEKRLLGKTRFEDGLRVARSLVDDTFRQLRFVVWIDAAINDDAALILMAADQILVSTIGEVTSVDHAGDELTRLSYQSLAKRRGLVPDDLAAGIADSAIELALVTLGDGQRIFASGESLKNKRASGEIVNEEIWASSAVPLRINADRFRSSQIASAVVDTPEEAADFLDLAKLQPIDSSDSFGQTKAVRLDISGSISPNRVRRWLSNLSVVDKSTNLCFVTLDSSGGNLQSAASLAATLVDPQPPLQKSVGVIAGASRGDAALVALACKPLYLQSDAILGGAGEGFIDVDSLEKNRELIELIAKRTGRSIGLIRGLLDGTREVYRYVEKRSGRVAYATTDELVQGAQDEAAEREKWERGQRMELGGGLSAAQALELGLIDGIVKSIDEAAEKSGLSEVPSSISDRALVRFVERLGSSVWLPFILLIIGFSALSAEMNAPGLGFPGFIALLCFGLFFWIKFLSGTAEWFELVALTLGLICICVELFVLPGTGIFGIGGLILTVIGIVLMSQTFVLPQNEYQLTVVARSVWLALGGLLTLVVGFVGFRMMMPHVPLFRTLVMEERSFESREVSEQLGNYDHLMGQVGIANTPLRPAGKAMFGDEVLSVMSDGSMIQRGASVRVIEVHSTRVVVEPLESGQA
jgi:membrane-bound serine protease (ClpP class)